MSDESTLTFPVTIRYTSEEPLYPPDIHKLQKRLDDILRDRDNGLAQALVNLSVQSYNVEVSPPEAKRYIPRTDREALRHLLRGLQEKGWQLMSYNDGDEDDEPVETLDLLIDAVLAVDEPVTVYVRHEEVTQARLVLLSMHSPEDLLVDHTDVKPLTAHIGSLWSIFDER